ncbi:MAG: hypothetical protein ACOH5I_12655 [Oligoflexus sp.]
MKKILFLYMISCFPPVIAQENVLLETFEEKNIYWRLADWGDGADIGRNHEEKTEGETSLEIHFDAEHTDRGKGLVLERDLTALPVEFDRIIVDVWSGVGDEKISLALAIDTDQYYESQSIALRSGWNRNISFDLNQSNYKSASTQWNYNSSVRRDQLAKKIMLLFYKSGVQEATILIDHVRLQKTADPCAACPGRKPRSRIESEPRNHPLPRELPLEIFLRRTS